MTIRTSRGLLGQINTSRRAVYGYDQRFEVLGSKGMLRIRNLSGTGAATVQWAASSAIATNQEISQKLLRQTSLPASHQYGLQIAEGMVTFFESL